MIAPPPPPDPLARPFVRTFARTFAGTVSRSWARRYTIVYLVLTGWFVGRLAAFYESGTGLTSMPMFGDRFEGRRLRALADAPIYTYEKSDGYDGQFYAQIAVAGDPFAPELRVALDSAGYRNKRAFLPMVAHLLGLGRPFLVVNLYALMGVAAWLALAVALARWWFPPTGLHNLLRWGGTMFSAGLVMSATHSLTDGAALLLIAAGVRALERGHRRLAAITLAIAGLARETSIVCGAIFAPRRGASRAGWIAAATAGLACALPALLWSAILRARFGDILGLRNFDWPLAALSREVGEIVGWASAHGLDDLTWADSRAVVAIVVQIAFMLSRPKTGSPWWRIGATFAVIALVLGSAVWEDPPKALTRALLPLTLAFNVLVPRTRLGLALLVAGNLSVLSAAQLTLPPAQNPTLAEGIRCQYGNGWFHPERLGNRTWRWAGPTAAVRLHNPNPRTLSVTLQLSLGSRGERTIHVEGGGLVQSIALPAGHPVQTLVGPLQLPHGDTSLTFETAEPPWREPGPGGRGLAFSLDKVGAIVEPGR